MAQGEHRRGERLGLRLPGAHSGRGACGRHRRVLRPPFVDDGSQIGGHTVGLGGPVRVDGVRVGHLDRVRVRCDRTCACRIGPRQFAGPGDDLLGLDDRDTVVGGQAGETGVPALPDRAELPLVGAQVQLPEHERGLRAGVGDLVAEQHVTGQVEHGQTQPGERPEAQTLGAGQARGDRDLGHGVGQRLHVDGDPVFAAVLGFGLAHQPDGSVRADRSVVEDEIVVGPDLAVAAEQEGRDVHVRPGFRVVPAQDDLHPGARLTGGIGEGTVLAFAQRCGGHHPRVPSDEVNRTECPDLCGFDGPPRRRPCS